LRFEPGQWTNGRASAEMANIADGAIASIAQLRVAARICGKPIL
jgi:hypothetical protein